MDEQEIKKAALEWAITQLQGVIDGQLKCTACMVIAAVALTQVWPGTPVVVALALASRELLWCAPYFIKLRILRKELHRVGCG